MVGEGDELIKVQFIFDPTSPRSHKLQVDQLAEKEEITPHISILHYRRQTETPKMRLLISHARYIAM